MTTRNMTPAELRLLGLLMSRQCGTASASELSPSERYAARRLKMRGFVGHQPRIEWWVTRAGIDAWNALPMGEIGQF